MNQHLLSLYHKESVNFVRGEGTWLFDDQGNAYLDALTGIGVTALGHSHPAITQAITQQAATLLQVPNNYYTPQQTALANKLCELTGLSNAYFSNSGAESCEAAIKMALKYGTNKGIKTPKIIVMTNAFHGRSLGGWSASCDQQSSQFGPLVPAFIRVPFNDSAAVENAITSDTAAIMVEPVLGKGGLLPADIAYLERLRQLCDQHDLLLIFDEVQSGMGRTGQWFAYQHSTIQPDILTAAKALGNGIPIGAFIASEKAAHIIQPGDHGSTQGGNPFACHVALTVIDTLTNEHCLANATAMGEHLAKALTRALSNNSLFDGIQGKGLMIGIRTKQPIEAAIRIGLDHGIIFNLAHQQILRLLPPLNISKHEADDLVTRMSACFDAFSAHG